MAAAKTVLKSAYDTMPLVVRVANLKYRITVKPRIEMDTLQCMGMCHLDSGEIWLADYLKDDMLAETLLHELFHAIHANFDLDDNSTEEEFTLATARGVAQLWYDNPKLMSWFGEIFSK